MTSGSEQHQSVVDVVASYHRGIAGDLATLRDDVGVRLAAGKAADVGASVERIVVQMVGVMVAEEQYVLPEIRAHAPDGAAAAEAQFDAHRDLERELRRLEDLELSADLLGPVLASVAGRWDALTATLTGRLLPPVAAALPEDRAAELGDDVLGAIEVAPTRPREVAVENAGLSKVVSFAEGWVDRWRDSWSRRGRGDDDVDV